MALEQFEWMVVCGALVAFAMAFGIGANDVANAFGTSVGSGALTLRQATVIAAVFEFSGAMGLGAAVTKTIAGGIASTASFKSQPDVFLYGMLCALTAAAIWLNVATVLKLPVSTTHSIVGGVFGFALAFGGADSVIWAERIDEFPYYKGMVVIMASWVTSPLVCGLLAASFFFLLRAFVLRSKNPLRMSVITLPIVVFLAIWASLWAVLLKGIRGIKEMDKYTTLGISAATAAGCGVIAACFMPYLLKLAATSTKFNAPADSETGKDAVAEKVAEAPVKSKGFLAYLTHGVDVNIFEVIVTDAKTSAIHDHAEKFDPSTEQFYAYAQIFSACCDSFSHGANDVANSVGPFAAIYSVYRLGKVSSNADSPKWILAIGGVGIVIGLATYGYNLMRVLGVQTAKITPSRGFCIEMTTAMVIAFASAIGLPLSTTHAQVGSTWGVGFLEGREGVNIAMSIKFVIAWVLTVFFTAGLSAALFAQGVYSPTLLKDVKG